jgi:hypothetical protein
VPVAAWTGELVLSWQEGKSRREKPLCGWHALDGVTLDGAPLALEGAEPLRDGQALLDRLRSVEGAALWGAWTKTERLPSEVTRRCAPRALRDGETLTWREQRFPVDGLATFVGCRAGPRLEVCRAPLPWNGLLAVGQKHEVVRYAGALTVAQASGMLLIAVFFALVAGAFTWRSLRRGRGAA